MRVRRIISDSDGEEKATVALTQMVEKTRFDAEVDVIVSAEPPLEVISQAFERSSMCFVGLAFEASQDDTNPLAAVKLLIDSVKGDVLLAKNWHDLHPSEYETAVCPNEGSFLAIVHGNAGFTL